jgi:hypothetical protein
MGFLPTSQRQCNTIVLAFASVRASGGSRADEVLDPTQDQLSRVKRELAEATQVTQRVLAKYKVLR